MNHTIKILLTFFLLGFGTLGLGQNPDIKRTWHWYFGSGAGLDFSSGTAVADTNGQLYSNEQCAAISDTSGNLLFYTDGVTIWNKNHAIMSNGTGLAGCSFSGSSSQGALIIPQPENDTLYYVFTTDCDENNYTNGFQYSVVNMSKNGGLGEVTSKNNLILAQSAEKLAVTHHTNGIDFLIVCHELYTKNYYAYLLTSTGLNLTPVVSNIGSTYTGFNSLGYLKFSPDGKRLATSQVFAGSPYTLELYDFDKATGVLTNLLPLSSNVRIATLCFSPDNSLLYVLDFISGTINQFDLCSGDSASIIASEIPIATPDGGGDIRIGPYGRIYLAKDANQYIGVIYSPNIYGVGANYQDYDISLNGRYSKEMLPNFVESYFFNDTLPCLPNSVQEQNYLEREIALVYPVPAADHINIELQAQQPETTQLRIKDLLGRNIHTETFRVKTQVDLTGFTNGIYLVEITQNSKKQINKIIINH